MCQVQGKVLLPLLPPGCCPCRTSPAAGLGVESAVSVTWGTRTQSSPGGPAQKPKPSWFLKGLETFQATPAHTAAATDAFRTATWILLFNVAFLGAASRKSEESHYTPNMKVLPCVPFHHMPRGIVWDFSIYCSGWCNISKKIHTGWHVTLHDRYVRANQYFS